MNVEAEPGAGRSWDRYWAKGHLHSCPTSFTGFYGEATQAFWRRQCEGLSSDDRVLDLGCGNGGLLAFLQTCFPAGQQPELHGVDAARVDPSGAMATALAPRRIQIHERTRFSELPLEDGCVSLAVSQFGIEYGNDEQTWTELLRVLGGEARVGFILHKRGARLDQVAADEVLLCKAALGAEGLVPAADSMVPLLIEASTEAGRAALDRSPKARDARARYNAATETLLDLGGLVRHGDAAHEILSSVADILDQAHAMPVAASRESLEVVRRTVEDTLERLEALRACALDDDGVSAICRRLEAAGFGMEDPGAIIEEGHEMGWSLQGARGA